MDRIQKNLKSIESSSLEKQWQICCEQFANLCVPQASEMLPSELISADQQRQKQVQELANSLYSNELIWLLKQAIEQLSNGTVPEGRLFVEQFESAIKDVQLPDPSKIIENWPGLIQLLKIDPALWAAINTTAQQWLSEGNAQKASPLFALLAFCQTLRVEPWFLLAFSLYQEERFELSRDILEIVLIFAPEQPEYLLLIAASYDALGEKMRAQEMLVRAEESLARNQLKLASEWKEMLTQLSSEIVAM